MRIRRLKALPAAVIIAGIGVLVYGDGLSNPFQGDDFNQIVNNIPVHSITHIGLFFRGGTFYAGQGLKPLDGPYFRPLMTTTFSLIYTAFGAHPFYYHLVQLLLCIGSAIILYLFFRYSFKPVLALFLSLIFLVHPINSQVVFAIPSMQDALFFFFGILALYLLIRFRSAKSLGLVMICLILSLLAKETAILFVILAFLYLFWWDRKRFLPLLTWFAIPFCAYLVVRYRAVGLLTNPYGAPIDNLHLMDRLLTAPSILLFYFKTFLFPAKLATGYYWIYKKFSVDHVAIPLLIDIAIVVLVVFGAIKIRRKAKKAELYTYLFFMIWAAMGLAMLLQFQPLDLTACDIWFYFPMAGILGMIGVALTVFPIKIKGRWLLLMATILIVVLGARTAMRGLDYHTAYTLAKVDISNSPDDYLAYKVVATHLANQGNYSAAIKNEAKAMQIYPEFDDFIYIAALLIDVGKYADAYTMYHASIPYAATSDVYKAYEGEGILTLFQNPSNANTNLLINLVKKFPNNSLLWLYLAMNEQRAGNNKDAKIAIQQAAAYGQISPTIYNDITQNISFPITIAGKTLQIGS